MKYEIGTQYKTRGGDKVMVLEEHCGLLHVFSYKENEAHMYELDGVFSCLNADRKACRQYDLIEPWSDPVIHEGWVNVFIGKDGPYFRRWGETQEEIDAGGNMKVAQIKIKFTEGDGL